MTDCLHVQRRIVCPGDPVRVANRQGLWRFIGQRDDGLVELVGAYSPSGDLSRTQEVARFFPVDELRHAGRATREQVMMNPEIKTWRRR